MNAKELRDGDFITTVGNIIKLYEKSWKAFVLNWQVFVGILAAYIVLGVIAWFILVASVFGAAVSAGSGSNVGIAGVFASFGLVSLIIIVMLLAGFVIAPLIIAAQLASARGKQHTFGEFFETIKPKILGFIGLGILCSIMVFVGTLLFIIPGLIIAFFLMFAPYIYIDRKIGVIDAIKASFEMVKEYWIAAAGIIIVNVLISIVGMVPILGSIAALVLNIVYFCLAALVYTAIVDKGASKEALVEAKK